MPLEAAKREALEEGGVRSDKWGELKSLSYLPVTVISEKHHQYWSRETYVIPEYTFGFECKEGIKLSREHTECVWHTYEDTYAKLNWDCIHDTDHCRDELIKIRYGVWDHMKNKGDHGAENRELEWVGFLPGKREIRRYIGEYTVTQNDVQSSGNFEDVVAYAGWTMDDHFPAGFNYKDWVSYYNISSCSISMRAFA